MIIRKFRSIFVCRFCLETGSVLDSRDVSYINEVPYQHKKARRRNESASDIDNQSIYSDDVLNLILFFSSLSFLNRSDRHHQFILLNHVNRENKLFIYSLF